MVTILPNQMFGLGDCIFTQTLVHKIANGNPIVWGVYPQFIEGLQRAYPSIKWVDYRNIPVDWNRQEQYECKVDGYGKCVVLPIRFAGEILKVPYKDTMKAKYELYGLHWQTWREKAIWDRDVSHEQSLFTINQAEAANNYTLVNETFGSDSKLKVRISSPFNGIELTNHNGYSLFDWAKTIENASAIHTVSTSIIYLLEMLDLKSPEIHLYNRPIKGQGFDNVDYILQKHKYIFHP